MTGSEFNSVEVSDERQLRVWQYLAGELSAEDAEAFEDELAADPSLCDDVLFASRLIAAGTRSTPLARPLIQSEIAPASRSWARAVSVAVACGICLIALVIGPARETQDETSGPVTFSPGASVIDIFASDDSSALAGIEDDADLSAYDLSAEIDVPSWLFAALELSEQGDASTSDPSYPDDELDQTEIF